MAISGDPEPYERSSFAPEVYQQQQPQQPPYEYEQKPQWSAQPPAHPPNHLSDNSTQQTPVKQQRRICGLIPTVFWLIVALVTVIILAAAIGGGVGGTMAQQNSQKLAAAQSSASAAYASGLAEGTQTTGASRTTVTVSSAYPISTPVSNCLSRSNQNYYSTGTRLNYTRLCGTDFGDGDHKNLFSGVMYTFDACIAICDSYNSWSGTSLANVMNYNVLGVGGAPPGACYCTAATPNKYTIQNRTGYDSAYLAGSFLASAVP